MTQVRAPIDELAAFARRSAESFRQAVVQLLRAKLRHEFPEHRSALDQLHRLLAETMTLADLLGRRRALLEFDAYSADHLADTVDEYVIYSERFLGRLADTPLSVFTFDDAMADIVRREPRLADPVEAALGGRPLWRQVADLYQEGPAFALARSTDLTLTKKIQNTVESLARRGVAIAEAEDVLAELGDYSRSYAETVYRTNLSTAYTAGRLQMVRDPAVATVIKAFRYDATPDRDVRPNHWAAHGLIAGVDDPIWETYSAPMGYQCRCSSSSLVSVFTLRRLDLLNADGTVKRFIPAGFAGAFPDPGFEHKRRPDRGIYIG